MLPSSPRRASSVATALDRSSFCLPSSRRRSCSSSSNFALAAPSACASRLRLWSCCDFWPTSRCSVATAFFASRNSRCTVLSSARAWESAARQAGQELRGPTWSSLSSVSICARSEASPARQRPIVCSRPATWPCRRATSSPSSACAHSFSRLLCCWRSVASDASRRSRSMTSSFIAPACEFVQAVASASSRWETSCVRRPRSKCSLAARLRNSSSMSFRRSTSPATCEARPRSSASSPGLGPPGPSPASAASAAGCSAAGASPSSAREAWPPGCRHRRSTMPRSSRRMRSSPS
mmetsp:Transcript_22093/g.66396  ORF Transcript_22093/g.66396 Transcript_22093/m.66396 type:complete len:294 (-) Transcript_22093:707-1588(-)